MTKNPRLTAVWLVGMLAALALALSACGSDSGSDDTAADTEATTEASAEGGNLGLLMDVTRNDKSFGQATYEGAVEAAEELGLELTVVDDLASDTQKAQSTLQNLASESDYLINGALSLMGGMPKIAEQYPDKQFSVYAVEIESLDNLHWAFQDWYPLGYLAGIAAAESTESNVVGFVGGGEIPPTIAAEAAFEEAVESVDPGIKVVSTITGDFEDTTKAKDATAAQIAQNADVVYSFLDAGHLGAVEAAKEAGGVELIGVVVPKCEASEGLEIGDTVSRQDQLAAELVRGMVDGEIENVVYGVQDPEIANLAFCPGASSPEVEEAVEAARLEFADGTLETPEKYLKAQSSDH